MIDPLGFPLIEVMDTPPQPLHDDDSHFKNEREFVL
jgi:hypothetical protein